MRLIVGSLYNPARLPDAEQAWRTFLASVPDPVPGYPATYENYPVNLGDRARAQTISQVGPTFEPDERIWIVMGEGFFASSQEEQALTLLHESCHARLLMGPTRERAILTQHLHRHEDARRRNQRPYDEFAILKYDNAILFRFHLEEVLAERMLVETHPQFAVARVQMYRSMREAFTGVARMEPELRGLGLLFEIARNDLGESISTTDEDRSSFQQMAGALERQLTEECGDAQELLALRAGLLDTVIPPLPALLACDELYNRTMSLRRQR